MGHWHAHLQCLTDMPCMTLGESLTGIGNAQQTWGYTSSAWQPVWVLQRLNLLALLVQGKWGIETPHRNLLVMERTHILIVISIGIVTACRWYHYYQGLSDIVFAQGKWERRLWRILCFRKYFTNWQEFLGFYRKLSAFNTTKWMQFFLSQ